METLLRSHALGKAYGETWALKDLSLEVRAGEIVGLLGPNGAGKTTAIHIFLGLLSPTKGEARVFGLDPLTHRHEISKRINFASAYVQLPSNLKVTENLRIFAKLYGIPHAQKRIADLLDLFEIGPLSGRLTGALSSGEKTRVNLAKCLLNDPRLLLLDEPTASLDPEMADTVRNTLIRVRTEKKVGILYTSHNMPEVEALCERIHFIHEGRVIAAGPPAEVVRAFNSGSLEQLFIQIVRSGDIVSGARKEAS